MTNSGKFAHYTPGNIGLQVVYGGLEECVRSAATGEVWRDGELWAGEGQQTERDPSPIVSRPSPDSERGTRRGTGVALQSLATQNRVLVPGEATGPALVLDVPLSLWGGLDPETGDIIDQRHPQWHANVTGRVLVMPVGKGSSSASSILLEAARLGTAPSAILLAEPDPILALGAAVARELYGIGPPVVVLDSEMYQQMSDSQRITLTVEGDVTLLD
jgi:predicted aconitase with swiveling domain